MTATAPRQWTPRWGQGRGGAHPLSTPCNAKLLPEGGAVVLKRSTETKRTYTPAPPLKENQSESCLLHLLLFLFPPRRERSAADNENDIQRWSCFFFSVLCWCVVITRLQMKEVVPWGAFRPDPGGNLVPGGERSQATWGPNTPLHPLPGNPSRPVAQDQTEPGTLQENHRPLNSKLFFKFC